MKRFIATLVLLLCVGCSSPQPTPLYVEVKIVATVPQSSYEGAWVIVETTEGTRHRVDGIWGQPGDKFKMDANLFLD